MAGVYRILGVGIQIPLLYKRGIFYVMYIRLFVICCVFERVVKCGLDDVGRLVVVGR